MSNNCKKILYKQNPLFSYSNRNTRTVFMDRDGVIIKDVNYIKNPADVVLEKGIISLFEILFKNKIPVIIVTNQSGIERGLFNWNDYEKVTLKMNQLIGKSSPIIGIYANGFSSNDGSHSWRKPNPGMIIEASLDLNININKSILIGDRLSDMKAGLEAGVEKLFHVLSGHGKSERKNILLSVKKSKLFLNNKSTKIFFLNDMVNFPYNQI